MNLGYESRKRSFSGFIVFRITIVTLLPQYLRPRLFFSCGLTNNLYELYLLRRTSLLIPKIVSYVHIHTIEKGEKNDETGQVLLIVEE